MDASTETRTWVVKQANVVTSEYLAWLGERFLAIGETALGEEAWTLADLRENGHNVPVNRVIALDKARKAHALVLPDRVDETGKILPSFGRGKRKVETSPVPVQVSSPAPVKDIAPTLPVPFRLTAGTPVQYANGLLGVVRQALSQGYMIDGPEGLEWVGGDCPITPIPSRTNEPVKVATPPPFDPSVWFVTPTGLTGQTLAFHTSLVKAHVMPVKKISPTGQTFLTALVAQGRALVEDGIAIPLDESGDFYPSEYVQGAINAREDNRAIAESASRMAPGTPVRVAGGAPGYVVSDNGSTVVVQQSRGSETVVKRDAISPVGGSVVKGAIATIATNEGTVVSDVTITWVGKHTKRGTWVNARANGSQVSGWVMGEARQSPVSATPKAKKSSGSLKGARSQDGPVTITRVPVTRNESLPAIGAMVKYQTRLGHVITGTVLAHTPGKDVVVLNTITSLASTVKASKIVR